MNTNPGAKRILCFGCSNTWGAIPYSQERLAPPLAWPEAMQNILGSGFEVINEGLFGRTLVAEDAGKKFKTGITHLEAILRSHEPLDLLIIMLGTNDVKDRYQLEASQIAAHLQQVISLAKKILKNEPKRILVICPPAVVVPETGELREEIKSGPKKFLDLPPLYKQVAERQQCFYLDANNHVSLEKTDGYHLDAASHAALAEAAAVKVKEILLQK
jgi:lysophospholipase L1-like esterase